MSSFAQEEPAPKKDPYEELALELAQDVPQEKVNIGVGNFVYQDTELLSPFSSKLRQEMERALGKTGKFKVIARDRLAELQMEGKFQGKNVLEPGTGVDKVSIEGVKGIVRGRFYATGDEVTVFAELAWLEGGQIKKARLVIPSDEVKTKIWPDPDQAAGKQLAAAIRPQNIDQSLENVKDIAAGRLVRVPRDFPLEIITTDCERAYAEGEKVSFRIRSTEDCHIAVLCHQSNGKTVVLFPNRYHTKTFVRANDAVDVPGTQKSGFKISVGEPFGSDVVQVVACTRKTQLHEKLSENATSLPSHENYQTFRTRGMAVEAIDSAISSAGTDDGAPLRWGTDSLVVSTFPKR